MGQYRIPYLLGWNGNPFAFAGMQDDGVPKILGVLKRGVEDMIVVAGGVIPDEDVVALKRQRIDAVSHVPAQKMIDRLKKLVTERGQR
jgi:methylmalonyl-CoA mutase cobalamin-binding domain/chain